MSYLVLARKWRPRGFDDLVGQEPIVQILKNALDQNRIAHAYIFSGPRGVGKTSTARILAKALNCDNGPASQPCGTCESCTSIIEGSSVDVIEIDGASNNSVDDIRDLRERVQYAPSGGKYKVYIIDEVHMLSPSAFNALLKTLEEPPPHVIFVLATTALKKIPATIISRCQHMPFRMIPGAKIIARLTDIAGAEGISISVSGLQLIARAAEGSMRDSLTILDQLSSFTAEIDDETVRNLLGIADTAMLKRTADAVISGDRSELLDIVHELAEQGTDLKTFTRELVFFFRNLLVASIVSKPGEYLELGEEETAVTVETAASSSEEQLTALLNELIKAEADVRNSAAPRLAIEMALLKASYMNAFKTIGEVIGHIDRIRGMLPGGGAPVSVPPSGPGVREGGDVLTADADPVHHQTSVPPAPQQELQAGAAAEVPAAEASGPETDIAAAWQRALEKVEAPLASKISQSVVDFTEGEVHVVLNGGHSVFEDDIKKNRAAIQKFLSEEAGREVKIRIVSRQEKKKPRKKDLREKVKEDPLVKEVLELFDGRIVDVTPRKTENTTHGGNHV